MVVKNRVFRPVKKDFPSPIATGQEIQVLFFPQVLLGDQQGNCLCFFTKTFSPGGEKARVKLMGEKLA